MSNVPCNGCTRCCHGDAIRILPNDDASKWQTVPHAVMPGHLMLAHKPNGDCIYLEATGCSIQSDKPQMCQEMDCRVIARAMTFTEARKTKALPIAIWRRGRDLLRGAP
jgi:Fe-S-cluster containining protein